MGDWGKTIPGLIVIAGVLLSLFVVSDIFFGHLGVMEYVAVRGKYQALVAKKEILSSEIKEMENEVNRLKYDMSYIEEIARGDLGFVKKREKIIIIDE